MRRRIGCLYGAYIFWRVSPRATSLLGPRHGRSRDRIDIDITWDCNLRCDNCNRSCQQAPTEERVTVGQIRRFLQETRERGVCWRKINLLGGEPTLHPDFEEILRMVLEFRDRYSPSTNGMVIINGYEPEVNAVLARIPASVNLRNTRKTLPDPEDGMEEELARFCSMCGFFRLNYTSDILRDSLASATWQCAYAAWHTQRPVLTRFPE
jgi:hypothetical protein